MKRVLAAVLATIITLLVAMPPAAAQGGWCLRFDFTTGQDGWTVSDGIYVTSNGFQDTSGGSDNLIITGPAWTGSTTITDARLYLTSALTGPNPQAYYRTNSPIANIQTINSSQSTYTFTTDSTNSAGVNFNLDPWNGTASGHRYNTGYIYQVELEGTGSQPYATNACDAPTNTPTPTFTPSDTPTATFTPTETYTPSPTHTPTDTPTPTNTPTSTYTPSPTSTVTNTPTFTPTNTATPSQTHVIVDGPTPTDTPTFTVTPSRTPTITQTPTVTLTPSSTSTPTSTPVETSTPTLTLAPTETFTPEPPTPTVLPFPTWTLGPEGSGLAGWEYEGRYYENETAVPTVTPGMTQEFGGPGNDIPTAPGLAALDQKEILRLLGYMALWMALFWGTFITSVPIINGFVYGVTIIGTVILGLRRLIRRLQDNGWID